MSSHQRSRHPVVLSAFLLAVAAVLLAPSSLAGSAGGGPAGGGCSGDPGYVLTIPLEVEIGSSLVISLQAPQGGDAFLLVSNGEGPTDTPVGTFCLDFPPVLIFHIPLPDSGQLSLIRQLPCDPGLVGVIGFFQFIAFSSTSSDRGISNQTSLTLKTGPCDDQLCTYTPGAWGGQCAGGNVACLRDANFDTVFPNGLVLGDQDGPDGDQLFALLLTSAQAVEDFLPQGGTSGTFISDATDPLDSTAGVFSGHLAAAKLAVAFDAAGLFDPDKNGNLILLGDMIFTDCVDEDLVGFSVNDVIAFADRVISGEFGLCDPSTTPGCQNDDILDTNGDTIPDVSIEDLKSALAVLNEEFDECKPVNGCFGFP